MIDDDFSLVMAGDSIRLYLTSANKRIHWSERYDTQKYWKYMASTLARHKPRFNRAHVVITVRFPDRRRRDVHNLLPLVAKPIVDGLVDAGVIPDDDDFHLVGPDMRRDPEPGPHQVTVEVNRLA